MHASRLRATCDVESTEVCKHKEKISRTATRKEEKGLGVVEGWEQS
jgi:hypothetical protein